MYDREYECGLAPVDESFPPLPRRLCDASRTRKWEGQEAVTEAFYVDAGEFVERYDWALDEYRRNG